MTDCVVYWARLPEHTDITSQGYIGVAVDFDERMRRHYKVTSRLDSHFAKAIRLYGWKNIIKEVVFSGSQNECYAFEHKLRPSFQIGWNEAIGGAGGDRSVFIDYGKRGKPIGNKNPKHGKLNPFFGRAHLERSIQTMKKAKAQSVIRTPDGVFYGFNDLGKHLGVHKLTAKKLAQKNGWQIHDQLKSPEHDQTPRGCTG